MKKYALIFCATIALSSHAQAQNPKLIAHIFDPAQLAGTWADNMSEVPACITITNHFKYVFDDEKNQLKIIYNKPIKTQAFGETNIFTARILHASTNSIIIRYDGEKRLNEKLQPLEWQLTMVAPDVFRWRATNMADSRVNNVIGIRCSSIEFPDTSNAQ